ncbi:MAG: hypothetical protein J6Y39_00355 [Bacteroidaceae bacterium]|nr:hypothetical protein [Bacteroidaceae bacterium]
MTPYHYLFQICCLLTLVAIPFALTKKDMKRWIRMILALIPIVFGVLYYLFTRETNGIYVALTGLLALFFVAAHPNKKTEEPS